MMQFNTSQVRAVSHGPGPCLVLAGPGSGKTTVITQRIQNLIDSYHVPPLHILAVTFSHASAKEMKERFEKLTAGNSSGFDSRHGIYAGSFSIESLNPATPTFGTFHSIFLRILKSSGINIRSVVSEKQKFDFMKTEIERYNLSYENITDLASDLLTQISKRKSRGSAFNNCASGKKNSFCKSFKSSGFRTTFTADILSGSVSAETFECICQHYNSYLTKEGLVDFDDMIIRCHDLFIHRPHVLSMWQETFQYILVDEFQDISPIQYDCIRMLAGQSSNLFVVGDDDQSIYGFRGSSPSIMKDFLRDYPNAEQILLDVNYRCAPCILNPALKVIAANKHRFEKVIRAVESDIAATNILAGLDSHKLAAQTPDMLFRSNKIHGCPKGSLDALMTKSESSFTIRCFPARNIEYAYMLPLIRHHLNSGLSVAVLFRNHADSSLLLAMLSAHNIPFMTTEKKPCIFEHFTIKDCLAYIRVGRAIIEGRPEFCRDSLVRIINKPSRYISRDSLLQGCFASMNAFYSSNSRMRATISKLYNDCRMAASLAPFAAIKYVRNVIGYDSWLREFAAEMHEDFSSYIWYLDELEELARGFKTLAEMEKAIMGSEDASLNDRSAGAIPSRPAFGILSISADYAGECSPSVQVMTMHHSKGLEFDSVFLPEINDSIVPNKKNLAAGELEEERRLFYVAMTRARRHLFISYVNCLHNKIARPSRFLDGLPPDG